MSLSASAVNVWEASKENDWLPEVWHCNQTPGSLTRSDHACFELCQGRFGVCKQWRTTSCGAFVGLCAHFMQLWLLICKFSAHELFFPSTKFWSEWSKMSSRCVGSCWQALENAQWSGKCWRLWKYYVFCCNEFRYHFIHHQNWWYCVENVHLF